MDASSLHAGTPDEEDSCCTSPGMCVHNHGESVNSMSKKRNNVRSAPPTLKVSLYICMSILYKKNIKIPFFIYFFYIK
jgi:hypothetical protein